MSLVAYTGFISFTSAPTLFTKHGIRYQRLSRTVHMHSYFTGIICVTHRFLLNTKTSISDGKTSTDGQCKISSTILGIKKQKDKEK